MAAPTSSGCPEHRDSPPRVMLKRRTGACVVIGLVLTAAVWALHDARVPVPSVSSCPRSTPARRTPPHEEIAGSPVHSPGDAAALIMADAHTNPADRQAARTNSLARQAEADPRSAFLHLRKHGVGASDAHLSLVFFRQWASADFSAAFDHADRHPAGPRRDELMGALALIVAQANPAEAAAMTELDMAPGPVRAETAISVLHQWALIDIETAIKWAGTFPQGPERERAIREVAGLAVNFPPTGAAGAPP